MKNLVLVLRLKDNARRLYVAPDGFVIPKGTILEVEFLSGTSLGVAMTDNREMDDQQEDLIREFLHINPVAEYRKVVNILNREAVQWPVDDPDADDANPDADEEDANPDADEEDAE